MARGDPRRRLLRSRVVVPGYAASGSSYSLRDMTDIYQYRGNFTKIVGNHTFKAGVSFNTNGYLGPGFSGDSTFSAVQPATREIPARPAAAWLRSC